LDNERVNIRCGPSRDLFAFRGSGPQEEFTHGCCEGYQRDDS